MRQIKGLKKSKYKHTGDYFYRGVYIYKFRGVWYVALAEADVRHKLATGLEAKTLKALTQLIDADLDKGVK